MAVVLVALIVSVIAPAVMALLTNRNRVNEKREDWARQDARETAERERQEAVAEQAERAAKLLLESNERVAKIAADAASQATVAAAQQNEKLDVIHVQSNATLTAAKEAQLAALEQTLTLLQREDPPNTDELAVVRSKVEALRVEIAKRHEQDALAAAVAAKQAEPAPPSVSLPAVVSTDPDAKGVPVVIEGTMTTPPDGE